MNSKVFTTLEYSKIKDQINTFLVTDAGRDQLATLTPSSDYDQVNEWLKETADGADIVRLKGEIPIPNLTEIAPFLKRLNIENASLSGTELAQIKKLLVSLKVVVDFFDDLKTNQVTLRLIDQLVEQLDLMPEITANLVRSVDDDGRILDGASSELRSIRRSIQRTQTNIRSRMDKFIKGPDSKYLSETIITVRDDRFVIPIKAEYKQKFGGIVHDQSASGQTLYVEPSGVVESNNELRRLQLSEREEERKILIELTESLRPYTETLKENMHLMGHLDFVNGKAKYAHSVKATLPILSNNNEVKLRKARHPLIDINKVVPNDIAIGSDYRSIIVTGPNTGGKTITIKTIGLIQLMGQSGLFITANEESQIGIFDDVFADIGDDQSIEANLSTFSSHLDNIISILDQITDRSLVLLDELGAGTDPKEGAALAMAIIDAIADKSSELIATTHYPELKAFAYDRPNTINASMEFDVETLKPTYRLMIGVPGQSNALNIAEKLGLPQLIIDKARSFTDDTNQDINNMISELTEQTRRARIEAEDLESQLNSAEELHSELKEQFDKYQNSKEKLIENARVEANQVVDKAKQQADEIIDDLHKKQARAGQAAVKENELMDAKGALNALEVEPNLKKNKVLKREKKKHDFRKGDEVLVKSYGQRGTLIEKQRDGSWEVQLGILKMKIDPNDLEKGQATPEEKSKYRPRVSRTRSSGISPTLDLRGERYEEAMSRLDQYIDSALLAGYPTVTIIHGKGTGALRSGVNDFLKSHPRVASFGYSAPNAGGDGSTVVKFK
ncbi:endonuclease MutS2 [Lentilactobacillus sp. SPB1-3]|uniref:Endonuclease MutS2 n=1 Tax=Lentilactobacillus terminaliae TaxID=3003483 RepID=A0ACD5DDJ1_9LACO|nr:endonuclease MutS2 [Lentilactobacillus sp. SPB1-3]MCZ0977359.1 endonuclease MutS2 [Lentilactobacillus sp. SPB1-3]